MRSLSTGATRAIGSRRCSTNEPFGRVHVGASTRTGFRVRSVAVSFGRGRYNRISRYTTGENLGEDRRLLLLWPRVEWAGVGRLRSLSGFSGQLYMSALDRCEAYVPREVDHATLQTYERNGASGSLISKMISSLQESPAVRDAKLKEHLERTQAKAQLRLLQTSLPILDYGEGLKKSRNHAFYVEKQKVRDLALAPLVVATAVGCQKYANLPPPLAACGSGVPLSDPDHKNDVPPPVHACVPVPRDRSKRKLRASAALGSFSRSTQVKLSCARRRTAALTPGFGLRNVTAMVYLGVQFVFMRRCTHQHNYGGDVARLSSTVLLTRIEASPSDGVEACSCRILCPRRGRARAGRL